MIELTAEEVIRVGKLSVLWNDLLTKAADLADTSRHRVAIVLPADIKSAIMRYVRTGDGPRISIDVVPINDVVVDVPASELS